jgi:hypothetical protein
MSAGGDIARDVLIRVAAPGNDEAVHRLVTCVRKRLLLEKLDDATYRVITQASSADEDNLAAVRAELDRCHDGDWRDVVRVEIES